MKRTHIFIILFFTLNMSGCTTFDISNDYQKSYNFQELTTYAWLPGLKLDIGDGRIDDWALAKRIKTAVETELNKKGFKKVEYGNEDFLLGFAAALNTPLYRDKLYEYQMKERGRMRIVFQERSAYQHPTYDNGTLIIDVIKPDTNEIVWRGSAQAGIQIDYVSAEKKKKRLFKAVGQILNKFPPSN